MVTPQQNVVDSEQQQHQQQDSRSILSHSTVSSMSTNHTTDTGNNNSMISILTTNSSSHHLLETRRRPREEDEDGDRTTTTTLRQGMESLQIHHHHGRNVSVSCNNGDGTSIATLSTTTTTTTTTTTLLSEPGSLITIVDDTTSSSSECHSGTSGDGSSEAQHHHHHIDEHGRNTLLHDLILDYSINVLTSPHCRAQYEQQIRNVAELNPEWVITYNHNGHTPFHIACQTGNIPLRIIQDLFYTYPSTITTPTQPPLERRQRRRRRIHRRTTTVDNDHHKPSTTSTTTTVMLPLHLVCRYYSGDLQYQIVQFLLQMYPQAARIWTQQRPSDDDNRTTTRVRTTVNDDDDDDHPDGMRRHDLAIHLYCQNHHCHLAVLQELLIPAYPESIRMKSYRTGQLPIHLACERQYFTRMYHRKYDPKPMKKMSSGGGGGGSGSHTNVSDTVIQYFLTLYPESVTIRDESRGEVPFLTAVRGHQLVLTLQLLLSHSHDDDSMATVVDAQGRTALHRYCIMLANNNNNHVNNLGPSDNHSHPSTVDCVRGDDPILQLLLQLDTQNMAGTIVDQAGRRPLHYLLLQQPNKRSVSLDVLYALIRSDPTFLELGRTARTTPTTTTTTTMADD